MENVQSKRGNEKLNYEGHFYVFDKLSADRSKKATETTKIPSVILNGALQQTSTAVQAKMANKDAICKVIQRRKIKTKQRLHNPPTALQLSFRAHIGSIKSHRVG
ncbi:hypothetical protein HZS_676 [Henneguya salminicola]|nr:hypothetical protein HZS_676 [Henneguya salminicola]